MQDAQQNRNNSVQERKVDEIAHHLELVREECESISKRLEGVAERLGYHSPKEPGSTQALAPVANGSLNKMVGILRAAQNLNSSSMRFLTEIEKQI